MVLSEYWKRLEEIFRNKIISAISQNDENYKNIFPPAFFNILKEPLLVQKQTIPQKKALILSFLELESLRAWHYQEGSTPTCTKRHWKKKVNLTGQSKDAKKNNNNCTNLIPILWAKCMPIAFELQQGSPWVFTNLQNLMKKSCTNAELTINTHIIFRAHFVLQCTCATVGNWPWIIVRAQRVLNTTISSFLADANIISRIEKKLLIFSKVWKSNHIWFHFFFSVLKP